MTTFSKVQTAGIAAIALTLHGCGKHDEPAANQPACAQMTGDCRANSTNPFSGDTPCCQYLGDSDSMAAPGELGLSFPKANLKLSYFEIPACSGFQFHYHNHAEALIMLEGDLVNPFVMNVNATDPSPILAAAKMSKDDAQVLPQNGGHTYVCVSDTGNCRWMSLWPEDNFNTSFMFPSNQPGKADTTPRSSKEGGPVIMGTKTNGKCDLLADYMPGKYTDILAPAPAGFTIQPKNGAQPEVCFTAGDGLKYEAKIIKLENDDKTSSSYETQPNCAYGVLDGEATWCIGDANCSDMPANTFFYAGEQGGSKLTPKKGSVTIYQACQSSTCTINNPGETYPFDLNLPADQNASEKQIFTDVVDDLCKNPALAHVENVSMLCPKQQNDNLNAGATEAAAQNGNDNLNAGSTETQNDNSNAGETEPASQNHNDNSNTDDTEAAPQVESYRISSNYVN